MIREQGIFAIFVYLKPTFSGIYTHFEIFLPSTNKIGMFIHCYIDVSVFAQVGIS